MIDLLMCVPTYRSSSAAIRFLDTAQYIQGNVLVVMTGVVGDHDLGTIINYLPNAKVSVVLLQSVYNSQVFGLANGVSWCVNNNITPRYVSMFDDDNEFLEDNSRDIIEHIEDAEPFSTMVLNNSAQGYQNFGREKRNEYLEVNLRWIDGNATVAKFEDCVHYGLRDGQPGATRIAYVEIEHQHRLEFFTGEPTVADITRMFLVHHTRIDPARNAIRAENTESCVAYGVSFWRDKFGIDLEVNPTQNNNVWDDLKSLTFSDKYNMYFKKDLLFGGLWNDWKTIYDRFQSELIWSNL